MPARNTSKRKPKPALNAGQRAFVREYLKDFNATQAATRAGYSAKTAKSQGQRLLTHADVAAAVAQGQERAAARAELKVDDIVQRYREIADLDITRVVTWDKKGRATLAVDDPRKLPIEVRRCITEIQQTDSGIRVKFLSQADGLNALAKHLGMFVQKVEVEAGERTANLWSKTQELIAQKRARGSGLD